MTRFLVAHLTREGGERELRWQDLEVSVSTVLEHDECGDPKRTDPHGPVCKPKPEWGPARLHCGRILAPYSESIE